MFKIEDNKVKVDLTLGAAFSIFLTIAFIIFRACNVITFSWLWILSPLWGFAVFSILIFVVALIVCYTLSKN